MFIVPSRVSPHFTFFPSCIKNATEKTEHGKCLSPVIHNPTNWRKPVDGEGCVGLPNDHGWEGNGGGLPILTPLLIYKIQIAMHPGHLVRGEAVGAVIICGDKKRNRRDKGLNLQRPPRRG